MKSFTFRRDISTGEILITVTILLALFAVVRLHQLDGRRSSAEALRGKAAIVAAKLARKTEVERILFEDLQPAIVEVSEKVAETHATQPANRMFYKSLAEAIAKSSERRLAENLDAAVADLFRRAPEFQQTFEETFKAIRVEEYRVSEELSFAIQSDLRDSDVLKLSSSPEVGNVLRSRIADINQRFLKRTERLSRPLWCDALDLISMNDDELLDTNHRSSVLDRHPVPKLDPPTE